ncbi:MAG: malate dehydrogenase [Chloroflexi bacterium]|nr:malate dehydrogenase [Chloroflexota bacterium]
MRRKISVIGAGNVGATCAQRLAERGYADVVLVDIVPGVPQGKALDMLQSGPLLPSDARLVGSNSYEETRGSDLVIITAGAPRRPGMSRDDLVLTNMEIVRGAVQETMKYSPRPIIIVVSNPLDAMAYLALKLSGLPRGRVVGMSGILDTARFRTFLAQELGMSVEDVQALVLGGHGDSMVPLPRLASVGGIPVTQLLLPEKLSRIVERTVKAGAEIVDLLKTSAYYAPAAAVLQMAEAVLLDKKRLLPCSTYLDGEYGIKDVSLGVPVKLGKEGIEQIVEIELTPQEQSALERSAAQVRELVDVMVKRGGLPR